MFKKLISIIIIIFITFFSFSQAISLEEFIPYYGYEIIIEENENSIEFITINNNYNEYEHITYIIATSRAIMKYSEVFKEFNIYDYRVVIFKSGDFISELKVEDLLIASGYGSRKIQQEYLNEQRILK